ncbi:MAG: hypothetical protein H0X24_15900 [Ktedonobacterales bacterium]|nr:hypothetical protein [Ktedonobacterales bacterium]
MQTETTLTPLLPPPVQRKKIPVRRKLGNTCSRCGKEFHNYMERTIDVQYPAVNGQAAIITYRCRDGKKCRKHAEKD